jgi:hypothetical protein
MNRLLLAALIAYLAIRALGASSPLTRWAGDLASTTSDPNDPAGVCIDPDGKRVPCPTEGPR